MRKEAGAALEWLNEKVALQAQVSPGRHLGLWQALWGNTSAGLGGCLTGCKLQSATQ
jgi:hypothetical protein